MRKPSYAVLCLLGSLAAAGPCMAQPQWEFSAGEMASHLSYGEGAATEFALFCSSGFGMVGLYAEIPGLDIGSAQEIDVNVSFSDGVMNFPGGLVQDGVQWMVNVEDPLLAKLADAPQVTVSAAGKSLQLAMQGADVAGLVKACGGQ